jgi:malto-oligosyltrehalose synthase/4-alpha-glucanotransferase
MYNPLSTYRIQFNRDFTFKDFSAHLDYLSLIGIETIYASPVFAAVPGSVHGYDVIDPHEFNPEIGSQHEFDEIIQQLKQKKMGWLQDIVPNHMAFHKGNLWLMDVLEKGRQSPYASYFDIDFDHPDFEGKLVVPFLGKTAGDAVQQGEINLAWMEGNFAFTYFEHQFPANKETIGFILKEYATIVPGYYEIVTLLSLPDWKDELHKLYLKDPFFKSFTDGVIQKINANPVRLNELLQKQHYLLCHWKETEKHLNYRRFFTINGLISLRMENNKVFEDYHTFIEKLIIEKKIQGLRIDHIDGLREPTKYFEKLRALVGDHIYIAVEKILESKEELKEEWPLQGTTGYDFLAMVNNLFTYKDHYPALQKYYKGLTGIKDDPEDIIYKKKRLILKESMQGDWNNLCRMFIEAGFIDDEKDHGITPVVMKEALGEFLLAFPWYKLYADRFPLMADDKEMLNYVFTRAESRATALTKPLKILQNVFLDQSGFDEDKKVAALHFFLRCMQFTGPLMAKGVEDTMMYDYNCFIAHNEVGDAPHARGMSASEFHKAMQQRQKKIPMTMNATSTHDTKRGEDARVRLNCISEISGEWMKRVDGWIEMNANLKIRINDKVAPTVNEEYFIYQTLIGIIPIEGKIDKNFLKRLDEYFVKVLREAKINSNWNNPDEDYEMVALNFVHKILRPESPFLRDFMPFQQEVAILGIHNSLAQVMLKVTCPGIPDFYQGTELWDLSMVDPDNRRPVDYILRKKILKELISEHQADPEHFFLHLYQNRADGRIKMWLTHLLIKERALHPDLFVYGQYIPIVVTGKHKDNILSFARTYKNTWYIVIIPIYLALLHKADVLESRLSDEVIDWGDTALLLPEAAPSKWTRFTDEKNIHSNGQILVSEVLKTPCPWFMKGIKEENRRKAGILLHVTSLPGKYGTGDMGNEAYHFIEFLRESGQSFWQVLPLNPVEQGSNYSPYSTFSAFAGNLMLISPDLLVKAKLVREDRTRWIKFTEGTKADFIGADKLRKQLLEEAFSVFKDQGSHYIQKKFEEFCSYEQYWLDDYALYILLKREFKGIAWNEWPAKIRDRDKLVLEEYKSKYAEDWEKEKFFQFLFTMQWKSLKAYANENGINIIGDISFYVSYDSVEVWQNPHLFKLNEEKRMLAVAGVPPDYFSKTGQLWNMPVYHWTNMKEDNYAWWRSRIRKNLEYCDLIRFDHFRGFSAYWEVPASERTAVNGQWIEAPGHDFLLQVETDFPNMPFIAEDLGDIDDKVYRLRDRFTLPGMRVLQFAFGAEMPKSVHIPHHHTFNSIVYTGTHDNNTIKGWFKKELAKEIRKMADEYTGHILRNASVHEVFIRLAYASVASIAIIPMQDILGLDEQARLNNPSNAKGNWTWKLRRRDLRPDDGKRIKKWAELYGRI